MGPVKFILSFCISFTILIGSTIEISVSGTVIRENNNAPLEGANVVFVSEGGEEFGASTDVSGKFNFYKAQINFDELIMGSQLNKENILFYEQEFNQTLLEDGFKTLLDFIQLKEFVKLASTTENQP